LSSNVGQSYPYTSESEPERAAVIARLIAAHPDLGPKIAAETTPPEPLDERHWVWKCPTPSCTGLLHEAGFAKDLRAVYVVCDGPCGKTFLR
jgi:hypothetical protein